MYCRYYLHPFVLPQLVWLLLLSNPTSGRQQRYRTRRRKVQQQQQPIAAAPTPPVLLFHGTLLNEFLEPLSNAFVQFWQADIHGNYAHPGNEFPFHEGKEPQHLLTEIFSYFGTARTDIKGQFAFRTYRPGIYASRPITHIHYKVFANTTDINTTTNPPQQQQQPQQPQLLLTSQFYFDDENIHGLLAGYDDRQILTLHEEEVDEDDHEDENEDPSRLVWTTTKTIVVNAMMARNNLTERGQQYLSNAAATNNRPHLTPWDVEGPFYPVVEFWEAGNDLTAGLFDSPRPYVPPVLPPVLVPITNQEDNEDDDDTEDDTIAKNNNSNVDDLIDDDDADTADEDADVEETEQDGGIQLSPNTTSSSSNDVTVGNAHPDSNDATLNWEFEDTKHNNTKNNDEDNAADVTSCVSIEDIVCTSLPEQIKFMGIGSAADNNTTTPTFELFCQLFTEYATPLVDEYLRIHSTRTNSDNPDPTPNDRNDDDPPHHQNTTTLAITIFAPTDQAWMTWEEDDEPNREIWIPEDGMFQNDTATTDEALLRDIVLSHITVDEELYPYTALTCTGLVPTIFVDDGTHSSRTKCHEEEENEDVDEDDDNGNQGRRKQKKYQSGPGNTDATQLPYILETENDLVFASSCRSTNDDHNKDNTGGGAVPIIVHVIEGVILPKSMSSASSSSSSSYFTDKSGDDDDDDAE